MSNMGTPVGIVLWVVVTALVPHHVFAGWQDGVKPARLVNLDANSVVKFLGNTTHDDHFKVLLPIPDSRILIGGRNNIYELSIDDLAVINRFPMNPDPVVKQSCLLKGKSDEDCNNYIRVITRKNNNGEYLICGTNAYNPTCAHFTITVGVFWGDRQFSGRGLCPYDHRINNTYLYVDDDFYVGSFSDFAGLDPLIYREPLRTEKYDLSKLNEPNFVKSITLGDYVYFFFREKAVEYMNCGKALYSRVARICRYDKGGPHKFRNMWTSYLKSRLNCSVGGDFPFYFNEIQAASGPWEGRYGGDAQTLIYGVFTTPENSISGSAVCAFTFMDIMDTFEGPFKAQEKPNANWLPVSESKVPEPRPGNCFRDSTELPDDTLNFTKANSLMDEAVPSYFNQPILTNTNMHFSGRFTSIEVDPQVKTPDGKTYDVLYIGTDNGRVLKVINTQSYNSSQNVEPFIIEDIVVFPLGTAIISLQIVRLQNKDPRLLVTSSSQVHSIPLWRCYFDSISTCGDCLALRDPHCVWDKTTQRCRAIRQNEDDAIQSVASGTHSECKPSAVIDLWGGELVFDFDEITVNLNEKLELNCGIKTDEYRYCTWERGTEIFQVQDVYRGVYSGMREPLNTENNQCGIVVDQANIGDQGLWTCIIHIARQTLKGWKNVAIAGAPNTSSSSTHYAP